MDSDIRLGLLLGTTKIIRRKLDIKLKKKKKKLQYLRQLVGVRYCSIFFNQETKSDLRVKEIIIIIKKTKVVIN